jgi:phage tail-like protein
VFGGSTAGQIAGGILSGVANTVGQTLFGGFCEVQGLNAEIEIETYQEGGRNDAPHRFFKCGRFPNLTFKRGLTFNTDLADWYAQVLSGSDEIIRKDGLVLVLDRGGSGIPIVGKPPIAAYRFKQALPERLTGPNLNAKGNEVAIETLELSHEGVQRVSLALIPGLGDLAGAFGGAISTTTSATIAAVGALL